MKRLAPLMLLAACAAEPEMPEAERDARGLALTERQLELLQLDEAGILALYGPPDSRVAPPDGEPVLTWTHAAEGAACDMAVKLNAEGQLVSVQFLDGGTDAGLVACERWL